LKELNLQSYKPNPKCETIASHVEGIGNLGGRHVKGRTAGRDKGNTRARELVIKPIVSSATNKHSVRDNIIRMR
jgi:hypothetical protein